FGTPVIGKVVEDAATSPHSESYGNAYEAIPTGKLSNLQEDDVSYYATAVLSKSKDRLNVATSSWRKLSLDQWRADAAARLPMPMAAAVPPNYNLPAIASDSGPCTTGDTWRPTFKVVPDVRYYHTAVWTGSEMIIWGGGGPGYLNSGGKYIPATDTWMPTSTTNVPTARYLHTAIWTGTEMIVWGGIGCDGDSC